MEKENMIKVHDLTVVYHEKPVLWNVNLDLPKESIIAIVGPNGAGKTTLLKAMLNLIKPISGNTVFNLEKPIKNKIGYVPQSESVDWDFPVTVLDVVMMGCYGEIGWIKRPSKKHKERAYLCLDKVGMKEFANRQISQLSGGQQQRIFLARSLMQDADIYFMDEPFKGIDVKTQAIIFDILKELKEQGKTIIVVHHDLQTIENNFDYIVLINVEVITSGYVSEVFTEENIYNTYYSDRKLLVKGVANE